MIKLFSKNELSALKLLLEKEGLPIEDIDSAEWFKVIGVYEGEVLAAAGGLERCSESLLLRSLVTHQDYRGRGLAGEVVNALHYEAEQAGYPSCWLLTTNADRYFSERHGYQATARHEASEGIRGSAQFSGLCPDSAVLMVREV